MPESKQKPPYWLGLLGIIPIAGAFVGLALILYGAILYKNWKLIVIGALDILLTMAVYAAMVTFVVHKVTRSHWLRNQNVIAAQRDLNRIVKKLEFYKFEHGDYPDSLHELPIEDYLLCEDATQRVFGEYHIFPYRHLGDHYTLYSVGPDEIPHTNDDIYPVIPDTGRIRYGWIKE